MDEYKVADPAHYGAGNNGQPELLYLISVILRVRILKKKTAGGKRGGGGIISLSDLNYFSSA